jgi:Domain of unknown function (DUF3806)
MKQYGPPVPDRPSENRKKKGVLASSVRMRLGLYFWLAFLLISRATFALSEQGSGKMGAPVPIFAELSAQDVARLERQRGVVALAVKERFGVSLTRTIADLPVLQRLVDDNVFAKSQTYELQCVGIAFGDVLVSELQLRWVMVSDEYGTDPTLRFEKTTLRFNALTMISKRIEEGRQVDIAGLFDATRDHLARLAGKTD